jgi:hypothetical protein
LLRLATILLGHHASGDQAGKHHRAVLACRFRQQPPSLPRAGQRPAQIEGKLGVSGYPEHHHHQQDAIPALEAVVG